MLRDKKILALLTALVLAMTMIVFTGCDKEEVAEEVMESVTDVSKSTDEPDQAGNLENPGDGVSLLVINTEPYCVTPADCDSAGYKAVVCDQTCELTFTAKNSEDVKWSVYLMEEQFGEDTRYISQAMEPALEGDGTIPVGEGMYLYVYCSANEFTTGGDGLPEGPVLEITRAE